MPSSSPVTTAQIVRTMKRGENGSSSVSMVPLGQILPYYSCRLQPDPTIRTMLYTISGDTGRGYDKVSRTADRRRGYRIIRRTINPSRGRPIPPLMGHFALQPGSTEPLTD